MDYYSGVRSQILNGYVFRRFYIGDSTLKLRNPTDSDFSYSEEVSRQKWKQDLSIVARCLYSVNGERITDYRTSMRYLEGLSILPYRRLLFNLISLIKKAQDSYDYLEAFCYEPESRSLWATWKAQQAFGYPPVLGVEQFTSIQTSWVIWNQSEDQRLESKSEWDRTFFAASAMNSSVSKIRKKWDSADEKEEREREKIRVNARKGITKEREDKRERINGVVKDKGEEDLRDEMRRWITGEEDEHDQIIREYKDRMRRSISEAELRAQRVREEAAARRRDNFALDKSSIGSPIVGLTDEQVLSLSKKRSSLLPTGEYEEKHDRIMSRYITTQESKGNLSVDEEGRIISKERKPLMEQVAGRVPKLEG